MYVIQTDRQTNRCIRLLHIHKLKMSGFGHPLMKIAIFG